MKYKIVENTFRCLRMFIMVLRIGYTKCYANVLQNPWWVTVVLGRSQALPGVWVTQGHTTTSILWLGKWGECYSHAVTKLRWGVLHKIVVFSPQGEPQHSRENSLHSDSEMWFQPVNVEFDACTSTKLQKAHQPKLIASANWWKRTLNTSQSSVFNSFVKRTFFRELRVSLPLHEREIFSGVLLPPT